MISQLSAAPSPLTWNEEKERALSALERVEAVRETLGTNVNPQLALAELARDLERVA